jgi:endoglucanase
MWKLNDRRCAMALAAAVLLSWLVPACDGTVGTAEGLGGPSDNGGNTGDGGNTDDGGNAGDGGQPDGGGVPDGGAHDAGKPDAGRADAGPPDAGRPDAGPPDAGRPDAGSPPDAGRPPDAGQPDGGTVLPLHASGNTLVDSAGNVVQLRGVNRAGTEYMCTSGDAIFDGPSDDASLDAIVAWNVNAIRIPLNEDCWLAINGVQAQFSGATYQAAIGDYVARAAAKGLYPILELHYTAPGTTLAGGGTGQEPMPDRDHSVAFWTSVATYFKGSGEVIFELFNEPFPDNNSDTAAAWTCWQSGGTCSGVSYTAAGMQELVTAVRTAGAGNLVVLGGVTFSNSLSQWDSHMPTDTANNLAAAWHVYNFNTCNSMSCFTSNVAPVAAGHPVIATEIGENDCAGGFITSVMGWLDGSGISYLAYVWNADFDCSSGPSLITDYDGTPTAYGKVYQTHLLSFP